MKALLLLSLCALSACSGLEIGTKAWINRVDEKQESQKTHRESVPLICYFKNCNEQGEEALK